MKDREPRNIPIKIDNKGFRIYPLDHTITGMWNDQIGTHLLESMSPKDREKFLQEDRLRANPIEKGSNRGMRLLMSIDLITLADFLQSKGKDQLLAIAAITELKGHGNERKAAQIVQELFRRDPLFEGPIRSSFENYAETLLNAWPARLPSCPQDYLRQGTVLEFLQ